ncbi:MAG: carbohydrate porin [Candidatus Omnitrophica bacterium]|nr:carbohydrate porin [Candidatus Omnitrophota bacterium]
MFKSKTIIGILLGSVFLSGAIVSAQEARDLESRVACLEKSLSRMNLGEGLSLGVHATMIIQGTSNANASGITVSNNSYKGDETTDSGYSVDLELEKCFADISAIAFLHVETGEGEGVTDNLELFSNVNRDSDDSNGLLTVTELFWEQEFNQFFTLTFGKLDAAGFIDTNEYANNECEQFLSSIFRNSPVIEFPDSAIGLGMNISFCQTLEFDLMMAEGNADYAQVGDHPWIGMQLNFKPEFLQRPGNYRLLYWYNDAPHSSWTDGLKTKEKASGFGISIDQEICNNLGVFLRAGWQDDDAFLDSAADGITSEDFSLVAAYSAGVQLSGSAWNRANDTCGIAYGMIEPSDDYKQAQARQGKIENHLEVYYNFTVNKNLRITPDVQFISNPFGKDAPNGTATILVAGLRVQIDF